MNLFLVLFCFSGLLAVHSHPGPQSMSTLLDGATEIEVKVYDEQGRLISSRDNHHTDSSNLTQPAQMNQKTLLLPLVVKLPMMAAAGAAGAASVIVPALTANSNRPTGTNPSVIVLPPGQTPTTQPVIQVMPTTQPTSCGLLSGANPIPCFKFSTGCYCISQTPVAWRTAFDTCISAGKRLISIDSLAKSTDLQANLQLVVGANTQLVANGWWTSGLYVSQTNNYAWAALGTPVTFTNWSAGKPAAPGSPALAATPGGICIHVAAGSLASQLWDEQACTAAFPYICE